MGCACQTRHTLLVLFCGTPCLTHEGSKKMGLRQENARDQVLTKGSMHWGYCSIFCCNGACICQIFYTLLVTDAFCFAICIYSGAGWKTLPEFAYCMKWFGEFLPWPLRIERISWYHYALRLRSSFFGFAIQGQQFTQQRPVNTSCWNITEWLFSNRDSVIAQR